MSRFSSGSGRNRRPEAELPAPGPASVRSVGGAVLVLLIIMVVCLWLILQGLTPLVALGVTAGIGLIAAEVAARFSGRPGTWLTRLLGQSLQA
ncbi:hypothetical protein [Actinocorallia aurantiaca]|uniref:AI-2E family transporter n=1 Tax=Actinocorallia aurantiaca TaxID=46204 RepID=A0ABN3UJG9_9ACTN